VSTLDAKVATYSGAFREHDIDGEALCHLHQEHMVKT
jgi:hypothetical protein